MTHIKGFLCSSPVYEFEETLFEFSYMRDPWPLKRDGEPKKRAGKKFYDVFSRFLALPEEEREKHRVGGGCRRF